MGESVNFLMTVLQEIILNIVDNDLIFIFWLLPFGVGVILIVIGFLQKLSYLDFYPASSVSDGILNARYFRKYNYGKYKKGKYNLENIYKNADSQAVKSDKLQSELIRKQRQDSYLTRNDEIRHIESQLAGVPQNYRRATAEAIYRDRVKIYRDDNSDRVYDSRGYSSTTEELEAIEFLNQDDET